MIIITESDIKIIVLAIKKARDAGILFIALDTQLELADSTDAIFATDNMFAGKLII